MMNHFPVQLSKKEQYGGWIYWVIQNFGLSVLLGMAATMLQAQIDRVIFDFAYLAINFTVLTVLMRRFLAASARQGLEQAGLLLQSAFLGYFVYSIASVAVNYLVYLLVPDFVNLNDSSIVQLSGQQAVLTHIGTVILAPVAEELVYRGLIFGCLYEKKPWVGYAVSTVVFSAIHVAGYIGSYDLLSTVAAFLQYLPAGLCLGWAYARSRNIWAPILMHIAINQIAMLSLR